MSCVRLRTDYRASTVSHLVLCKLVRMHTHTHKRYGEGHIIYTIITAGVAPTVTPTKLSNFFLPKFLLVASIIGINTSNTHLATQIGLDPARAKCALPVL